MVSAFYLNPANQLPRIYHTFLHLAFCSALQPIRNKMTNFTIAYCDSIPHVGKLALIFLVPQHPLFCQFLIDCSPIPQVISLTQTYGAETLHQLFHITRTWCYALHYFLLVFKRVARNFRKKVVKFLS